MLRTRHGTPKCVLTIAQALLKIHEDRTYYVKWVVGVGIGIVTVVLAVAGVLIAVLG